MTEPPSYPKTGSDERQHASTAEPKRSRSHMVLLWVIVGGIIILMLVLHLAGVVGPGTKM